MFPLLANTVYLFKGGFIGVFVSINLLLICGSIGFLTLFSGANVKQGELGLIKNITKESILDYECVGSNIWLFLCTVIIPNLITIFKVLTN